MYFSFYSFFILPIHSDFCLSQGPISFNNFVLNNKTSTGYNKIWNTYTSSHPPRSHLKPKQLLKIGLCKLVLMSVCVWSHVSWPKAERNICMLLLKIHTAKISKYTEPEYFSDECTYKNLHHPACDLKPMRLKTGKTMTKYQNKQNEGK